MSYSSIWPTDRTLSGATIQGQSRSGSNGNVGVLRILQNSSIPGVLPPDYLVSHPGHLLGKGILPLSRDAVSAFYSPSQLDLDMMCRNYSSKCQVLYLPAHHSWQYSARVIPVANNCPERDLKKKKKINKIHSAI